ncbi:MAG: hypothetical protein MMC23_009865 [Stictis urceolatum]|nr:hypothetical protein [Stictis urceolata]
MSLNFVPLRKLGKDDPSVPALGFGLIGMALLYGTPPEKEEVFKFLERAVEIGETFWDTSEIYGDNEEMLSRWFKRTG